MTAKELIKEVEAMLSLREDRDVEVRVDVGAKTSYALVGVDLVEDLAEEPTEEPDVIVLFSSESLLA